MKQIMKNINILNLFIFSFLMFTACNPLKKMIELSKQQQINVNPDPITLAGSTVSFDVQTTLPKGCLLYTSPSPRDGQISRMPSSA